MTYRLALSVTTAVVNGNLAETAGDATPLAHYVILRTI